MRISFCHLSVITMEILSLQIIFSLLSFSYSIFECFFISLRLSCSRKQKVPLQRDLFIITCFVLYKLRIKCCRVNKYKNGHHQRANIDWYNTPIEQRCIV